MAVSQTRNIRRPLINFLRLNGIPILVQLHLEERLLRTTSENWCLINDGTTDPTIVMGVSGLVCRSNDYVLGDRKLGGNAQSITKNRWIHHTSFLWDYGISRMGYLKLPKRAPEYRQARDHLEFICRMKDYMARSDFIDKTINAVGCHFLLRYSKLEAIQWPSGTKFEPSSRLLRKQELEEAIFKSSTAVTASLSL